MTSADKIIQHIEKYVPLSAEEKLGCSSVFKIAKFKKKQFIIQPGFVAKHRYFVLDGAIKAYVIGDEGQEHTVQLAIDEWWISDYNSYMFQRPASMFVTAVEDTVALQISFEDEQKLKAASHATGTFFRIIAERSVAFMQRRIISNLTMDAKERYDEFQRAYPQMVTRFPQYVIASYLGMTTEFLSKIRNQKVKKKS